MAANNTSKATSRATLDKNPAAVHQYDDWLLPAARRNADAVFASGVVDVARGTGVIASILVEHLVNLSAIASGAGASVRPLLADGDVEALARLAALSLEHLHQLASNRVDDLNSMADGAKK